MCLLSLFDFGVYRGIHAICELQPDAAQVSNLLRSGFRETEAEPKEKLLSSKSGIPKCRMKAPVGNGRIL